MSRPSHTRFVALALGLLLAFAGCAQQSARTPPAPSPGAPGAPNRAFTQEGQASWYGANHHGKTTANGEPFDMEALSAAHRTLPFGTLVRVTNKANGKTVTVRINDRGPFVNGRIIDLSARAARELGIMKNGVAAVRIEQVAADQANR